ncbi:MAG: glycerol-3-phosphate dehydrogenase [Pseudomonadota bacterium]
MVKPMQFVLPLSHNSKPSWVVNMGLYLYDFMGGSRHLPKSHSIDLAHDRRGDILREPNAKAYIYSDCWVDDSRLVVANAMDARERSAEILTRCEFSAAYRCGNVWEITLAQGATQLNVQAKVLINAAGPWANRVKQGIAEQEPEFFLSLVTGSHIIVPRIYNHDSAYILQNDDHRVIFAIPYEEDFTMIGTTDISVKTPEQPRLTGEEAVYLCGVVNSYFNINLKPSDVVTSFSGVRPLYNSAMKEAQYANRDYHVETDFDDEGNLPVIHIYGGKLTTYRRLSEKVTNSICRILKMRKSAWTSTEPLPGGNFNRLNVSAELQGLMRFYNKLPNHLVRRLFLQYGTKANIIADVILKNGDFEGFGRNLTKAEVNYLYKYEWARTAEDILWRRTKLGLHYSNAQTSRLSEYLAQLSVAS